MSIARSAVSSAVCLLACSLVSSRDNTHSAPLLLFPILELSLLSYSPVTLPFPSHLFVFFFIYVHSFLLISRRIRRERAPNGVFYTRKPGKSAKRGRTVAGPSGDVAGSGQKKGSKKSTKRGDGAVGGASGAETEVGAGGLPGGNIDASSSSSSSSMQSQQQQQSHLPSSSPSFPTDRGSGSSFLGSAATAGAASSTAGPSPSSQSNSSSASSSSSSSGERDLLSIDDSKLTREERNLKRALERFMKIEEQQKKQAQSGLQTQAASAGGSTSGAGFGTASANAGGPGGGAGGAGAGAGGGVASAAGGRKSASSSSSAGASSASTSSSLPSGSPSAGPSVGGSMEDGMPLGPGGEALDESDPRVQRMLQRERARILEAQQNADHEGEEDEDGNIRPATPEPIGPARSIYPVEWTGRKLYPRSEMYLGKKSYLLSSLSVREGPFQPGFARSMDAGSMSKRLLMNYAAEQKLALLGSCHGTAGASVASAANVTSTVAATGHKR